MHTARLCWAGAARPVWRHWLQEASRRARSAQLAGPVTASALDAGRNARAPSCWRSALLGARRAAAARPAGARSGTARRRAGRCSRARCAPPAACPTAAPARARGRAARRSPLGCAQAPTPACAATLSFSDERVARPSCLAPAQVGVEPERESGSCLSTSLPYLHTHCA